MWRQLLHLLGKTHDGNQLPRSETARNISHTGSLTLKHVQITLLTLVPGQGQSWSGFRARFAGIGLSSSLRSGLLLPSFFDYSASSGDYLAKRQEDRLGIVGPDCSDKGVQIVFPVRSGAEQETRRRVLGRN